MARVRHVKHRATINCVAERGWDGGWLKNGKEVAERFRSSGKNTLVDPKPPVLGYHDYVSVVKPDATSPPPDVEAAFRGRYEPTRDPDFWFEDGNIVIIADETQFRVHRSILCRHSDVLADRLGFNDRRRDTSYDSCAVVRILDSAKSFKGLLRLLYPGPSEILRQVSSDRILAGSTHITHQYILGLLPASFDEWMNREERAIQGTRSTQPSPRDMIKMINALRDIQGDDLMPIALYLCCQLSPKTLLSENRRSDGTVEKLSSKDVELCLALREDMVKESACMAMRLFTEPPYPRCKCRKVVEETFMDIVNGKFEDIPRTDPLGPYWRRHIDESERDEKMHRRICSTCAQSLRDREVEQRRELWDELPRLVGF
ncbi:hypothetical protein BD309DRAFT_868029 [Dichomitus squalens]|nr:hypothetical protein BD309DRAFT_868029 [Dichomitus squalens]